MKQKITELEVENYKNRIRKLANSGQNKKAYNLANELTKKHPERLEFKYYKIVFSAEETRGFTEKEIAIRYKKAALELRPLTQKLRGVEENLARVIKNEYYWFSQQPYKQYKHGVYTVTNGNLRGYYSQGVGACQVSYSYALQGKKALAFRWAKISIHAWEKYFKVIPDWYNSYLFYGKAFGILGDFKNMQKAYKKASKISKLPLTDAIFKEMNDEVSKAQFYLNKSKKNKST